jgi:hypothetical protein
LSVNEFHGHGFILFTHVSPDLTQIALAVLIVPFLPLGNERLLTADLQLLQSRHLLQLIEFLPSSSLLHLVMRGLASHSDLRDTMIMRI